MKDNENRRRKRTRKKSSPDVRSLQTREEQPNVQAETEPMPQQESEVVAETNTGNTNTEGGNEMYGQSFGDRIREHKAGIIQVIVGVAIAVAVSALMIMLLAATKGDISTEAARVNGEFDKVSTHINSLGSGLNSQIDALEVEVNGYNTTLDILGTKAAGNSHDITVLQDWAEGAETRITTVEAENSPPEGYLTGTVGNYTLHAKCNEAGNFTANVHLVYSRAFGCNGTYEECQQYFYSGINWTQGIPAPTTIITYNGTAWNLAQLWWNIGTFAMTANNETAVSILSGGLNSTYAPNFAYVEVWPVLK